MSTTTCNPCTCTDMYYRTELSFRKAVLELLCELIGLAAAPPPPPTTAAVFAPLTPILFSGIGAGYALGVDLPDDTKSVNIVNHTDGDVYVSMDGGVSNTFLLGAAESVFVNLVELGLVTTAIVQLKQGAYVPTTGLVLIYSVS